MAAPCPFCPKTRTSTYGRSNSAFPDRTIVGKPRLEAVWPLVHGGQRLMAWAVSNARVEPKGNAIVITKQASGTAKIDPLRCERRLLVTRLWSGWRDRIVSFAMTSPGLDGRESGRERGRQAAG